MGQVLQFSVFLQEVNGHAAAGNASSTNPTKRPTIAVSDVANRYLGNCPDQAIPN